ncbi:uncharacterized protein V1510DRAFT_184353 [Dipodascopsis tothii]|uniref:uncharacterized protein n=1 Tax=Dipodascopsis tothii TaxID=44089 RepID=UPI0034CDDD62
MARTQFSFGLLLGDPFALATLSVSIIGWLIAFVASIAADIQGQYPAFSWWGLVFQLLLIAGITFVMGTDGVAAYRVAVVGYAAAALVYTTNSTNNLVYNGRAADAAAAAGHILLSIINILWILYFGTTAEAAPHAFVDSYALHKDPLRYEDGAKQAPAYYTGAAVSHHTDSPSVRPTQMYTSAQLGGFETTSMRTGSMAGRASAGLYGSGLPNAQFAGSNLNSVNGSNRNSVPGSAGNAMIGAAIGLPSSRGGSVGRSNSQLAAPTDEALAAPTDYPLRARALYSYEANPEDANEISFEKGEILEVSDISGRWWQARRANGEVGICPSNYVELVS